MRPWPAEHDEVRHIGPRGEVSSSVAKLRVGTEHGGDGIVDDVVELVNCEPPVDGHKDRAKPSAGELHFDELDTIHREHHDAVTPSDAKIVA